MCFLKILVARLCLSLNILKPTVFLSLLFSQRGRTEEADQRRTAETFASRDEDD